MTWWIFKWCLNKRIFYAQVQTVFHSNGSNQHEKHSKNKWKSFCFSPGNFSHPSLFKQFCLFDHKNQKRLICQTSIAFRLPQTVQIFYRKPNIPNSLWNSSISYSKIPLFLPRRFFRVSQAFSMPIFVYSGCFIVRQTKAPKPQIG